ncbi:MAG: YiiX/YebB-like N1pC/P60 family cysteine hydrolase [Burkholderiales bacterium]
MIPLAMLVALLQGCATSLEIRKSAAAEGSAAASEGLALRFQSSSIAREGNDAPLSPGDLQPGDIILTSAPTLWSVGIRLMTWAPVSHAALYVGDGRVVEAVRSGVRVRRVEELLEEQSLALVLRYPELSPEQTLNISDYALQQAGAQYNSVGVALNAPFSVARRACELPLVPSAVRDACIRSIGALNYFAASEGQLFCSQLVMQAYRHARVRITGADPRLISPADILHMREGDVPSVRVRKQLRYVGHLKYPAETIAALQQ